MLPIVVADNFLRDVDNWRQLALLCNQWSTDPNGMWPGMRTPDLRHIYPDRVYTLKDSLEAILPAYSNKDGGISYLECCFQSISADWGSGWIHEDKLEWLDFAGIVYLDPTPQPDSGTTIYDFIGDSLDDIYSEELRLHKAEIYRDTSRHDEIKYIKDLRVPHFTESAKIHNKYNRCAVYGAGYWHAADKYYGSTLQDSRLTLVFFGKFNKKD